MARYVSEALRGQLALASASGAPSGNGLPPPVSFDALRSELTSLVLKAVADATSRGQESAELPADVVEEVGNRFETEAPGAPVANTTRVVTGIRGLRESGFLHDVVACDPCLPKETWVTRCGWRFGGAAHVVYEQGASTCPKCAICRRTGRGALFWEAKKRRVGPDCSEVGG